ncbi:MAG: hypothetical protein VXW22_16375 [Pseudomonadota bacterium]|nr:hypothetical protein [Pseudomonadota bacterium]
MKKGFKKTMRKMKKRTVFTLKRSKIITLKRMKLALKKKSATLKSKKAMKAVLDDIQSGKFARDWVLENQAGAPSFLSMRARTNDHLIEEVGAKLRGMMHWAQNDRLVDKSRN